MIGITEDAFKKGMRQLAAAVNVITVAHNGAKEGLTATAACSVSAEPPQVLVCVNTTSGAHDIIQETGAFCLNVLARDQEDIAMGFAGMDGADRSERFDLGSWCTLATGMQRLGVRFEVTEAILNHKSGSRSGVAGVYQLHEWAEEKRSALDAWAQHVVALGSAADETNVVHLAEVRG